MIREVLKQALEALEYENSWHVQHKVKPYVSTIDAITALRAALAEPEPGSVCARCGAWAVDPVLPDEQRTEPEQEPVAWGVFEGNLHDMFFTREDAHEMAELKGTHATVKPLYTRPADDTALLRQALEVMDKATRYMRDSDYRKLNETITTLRERLGEKK